MSKYYPTIKSNTFIYKIICPETKETKYIGQTTAGITRFYDHITSRYKENDLYRWILTLYNQKIRPIFEVIEYCDYTELDKIERYYISKYDNLYNLTEGGQSNMMSKNHNSKFTKGKTLESYYGKEKADSIKKRTSESLKGEKNPNYQGQTCTDEWKINQSISQSKKSIKIVNSFNGDEHIFSNSKAASTFLNCGSSLIRECKKNGWKVHRIWYIHDHLNITT